MMQSCKHGRIKKHYRKPSSSLILCVAALRSKRMKYGKRLFNLREFLTSVSIDITVLWLVRPCNLVDLPMFWWLPPLRQNVFFYPQEGDTKFL
jgi:hypothetical protein